MTRPTLPLIGWTRPTLPLIGWTSAFGDSSALYILLCYLWLNFKRSHIVYVHTTAKVDRPHHLNMSANLRGLQHLELNICINHQLVWTSCALVCSKAEIHCLKPLCAGPLIQVELVLGTPPCYMFLT